MLNGLLFGRFATDVARILFWGINFPPIKGTPSNFVVQLTTVKLETFSNTLFNNTAGSHSQPYRLPNTRSLRNEIPIRKKTQKIKNAFVGVYTGAPAGFKMWTSAPVYI